jgi:TfoX/Sxy family transcriptional regulator of competence genes
MEKWKKSSPELGKLLEGALVRFTCDQRKMFGSPVYMINRNMFAGVHQDNIFIRLSEADRKSILSKVAGAMQFEPLKGHIMKEYITVPETLYRDGDAFQQWLKRSASYAASLPPKASKKKKTE